LSESLIARQENITKTIEDSEKRLEKAIVKLDESQKQLVQSGMIVSNINEDSEKTAKQVKSAILNDGKIEVERITVSAKNQVITMESIIRKEISAHVVNEALKIVTSKLEEHLDVELQNKIIDKNISKIKD
jgi:F-type H+-transporting ATPase subunit b